MKRRTLATALNFAVPGVGLWYLGRVKSGFLNLLLAIVVPVATGVLFTSETTYGLYALLAVAAGSAGYAHAVGTRHLKASEDQD